MQLPNSAEAYIQIKKLTDYLLSESHKDGKAKAKFFRELGFDKANVKVLENELLHVARNNPVTSVIESTYGLKYVIVGKIESPLGKMVSVLTVWIVDTGRTRPRFVTARPHKRDSCSNGDS